MKAISLALFGFGTRYKDCHSYYGFLVYLGLVIRAYSVLFPDWRIVLHLEKTAANSELKPYFDFLSKNDIIDIIDMPTEPLCKSMLWRIEPVKYADYTICRDIDSLPTLRERQAVEIWLRNDTLAHAINDSVGHCIPLLGGMIGFKKNAFNAPIRGGMNNKGDDQGFLQRYVLPQVKHSITEHRILGMTPDPNNKYSYGEIEDIDVGLNEYKACNDLVNHIGQGGFHVLPHFNDLIPKHFAGAAPYWVGNNPIEDKMTEIESQFKKIFYWQK